MLDRDEMVVKYMPLVHYVVNNLTFSLPPMLDTEDLISYGTMGLINAIDRFDTAHGVKFETYAVTRIRGYIIDQLRSLDWIPRSTRQRTRHIEQTRDELEHSLGRLPTADEVAQHAGLDRDKYDQAMKTTACITISLDAILHPDDENGSSALLQLVHDKTAPSPFSALEEHDMVTTVSSAITTLPEREQRLLRLYYFEERTLQEISRVLEVSESRVCQLHSRALRRLRTVIAA
jgi:RNA polymerase sigma factor for flagellar operon FliA